MEETVSIDYESKYKELQEEVLKRKREYEIKTKENAEFYSSIIREKDTEINWLKSVINGILHI